ncbi:SGNH/GDSL hydrolase family protein [Oerskovia sp. Sa1BUA8]|uniref:SGNH/GDSL hydrolase family protein n=1 Tax=Oerskovia douganii TaxID=2762210 RepID=A0A9D5Z085_9CELL|nr:SGNH/GDSL hydrolase family protein [Oerskovia douganii]MBE7701276.1 SGNH/GDSL hydrolase family protein [Oerskovia douganii]
MSVLVPEVDLAPSVTSRVVTIHAIDMQEGAPANGQVTFTLPADVHVPVDDLILQAGSATVTLADGRASLRLPCYDPDARPEGWVILVKKSWAPHPYAIRVPMGATPISLVDIEPIAEADPGMVQWLLTGASATVTTGASPTVTVDVSSGVAHFSFTLPSGAWSRGAIASGTDLDTLTTPGQYWVTSSTVAISLLNAPPSWANGSGTYEVLTNGAAIRQRFARTESTSEPLVMERVRGGSWGPWIRTDIPVTKGNTTAPDLASLPQGWSTVWNTATATNLGLPDPGLGVLQVVDPAPGVYRVVLWYTATGAVHSRSMTAAGTWTAWSRVDASAVSAQLGSTQNVARGSGLKTIPVAVTLGQSNTAAPLTGTWRVPLLWAFPITRWRLHVTNRNPRFGTTAGAGIVVDGVWLGDHAGMGAFATTPDQVAGPFTVPDDGAEHITGWLTLPIGDNVERLLSFSYTAAAAPPALMGHSFMATGKVAPAIAPAGMTSTETTPLDWWIEAETYAGTPVVAVFGDSLAGGSGATRALLDSPLSVLCRDIAAAPVHYAASADSMSGWLDTASHKATRWLSLTRPDAVLWSMGHNDVYGTATPASLATMQDRFNTLLPWVKSAIAPMVVVTTITPRATGTSAQHQVRHDYNAWLLGRVGSGAVRDLFDYDAAVAIGDALRPEYDSDGVHLNAAGYAAARATVSRPVTAPAIQYV